jgi:hypothetical protein
MASKRHHGHNKSHQSHHKKGNENYTESDASRNSLDNNYSFGDYSDINYVIQDSSAQYESCSECKCSNKRCCEKRGPPGPPGPLVVAVMENGEYGLAPNEQKTYCLEPSCNLYFISSGCFITINCSCVGTAYFRVISIYKNVITIVNYSNNVASWSVGAFVALVGPQGVTGSTGATGSFPTPIVQEGEARYGVMSFNGTDAYYYDDSKTFVIEHPTNKEKFLIHACLEGPEAGVYYRGESEITNNTDVTIELPHYVDKLATNLTLQVTPIYNGTVKTLGVSRVKDNKFSVYGENCEFFWTVFGKRLSLDTEPNKKDVVVKGDGPYKWI